MFYFLCKYVCFLLFQFVTKRIETMGRDPMQPKDWQHYEYTGKPVIDVDAALERDRKAQLDKERLDHWRKVR